MRFVVRIFTWLDRSRVVWNKFFSRFLILFEESDLGGPHATLNTCGNDLGHPRESLLETWYRAIRGNQKEMSLLEKTLITAVPRKGLLKTEIRKDWKKI